MYLRHFDNKRDKIGRIDREWVLKNCTHLRERDIEILKLLSKFQFLTRNQIALGVFYRLQDSSASQKANERLGRLFEFHCVDKFQPLDNSSRGQYPHFYYLDRAGALILDMIDDFEFNYRGWRKIVRSKIKQNFLHESAIDDILFQLIREKTRGNIIDIIPNKNFVIEYKYANKKGYGFHKKIWIDLAPMIRITKTKLVQVFIEVYRHNKASKIIQKYTDLERLFFQSKDWCQGGYGKIIGIPLIVFTMSDKNSLEEFYKKIKKRKLGVYLGVQKEVALVNTRFLFEPLWYFSKKPLDTPKPLLYYEQKKEQGE